MSFVREHRTAAVIGVVVALVTSMLVVLALSADGYESRHVSLNDGGIWVTSDADGLFGRLNKPAGSIDLAFYPPGGAQTAYTLDVRQQGAAVTAWDKASGRLMPVDVTTGKAIAEQGVPVSADEHVDLDGGTLAVLDPGTNKLWATQVDPSTSIPSLSDLDPSTRGAAIFPKRSGDGTRSGDVAVGVDGSVYAANTSGDVATLTRSGQRFGRPRFTRLDGDLESVQVTAIGSKLVVYDPQQGVLHLPGNRTTKVAPDPEGRIQPPSGAGSNVVIATRTALLRVPLDGGAAKTIFTAPDGRPAAPTRLGDCVHAAWAGEPGVYARSCGDADGQRVLLPAAKRLQDPVFRVNRGSILLNDLALGSVYDLDSQQEVDNWSQVKPPPVLKPSKNSKNNTDSSDARDQPPKAVDDTWGARPGRTTVLHVLDNDSDPKGAILSIRRVSQVSDRSAQVTIAPDGQSVEVTLPDTIAGDVRFKYSVDDGKLTAQAAVTVQVRAPNQNEKPKPRRGFTQTSFTASSGGRLDLPVLDDWRDFDGDPLVISSTTVEGVARGTVAAAPSGRLNFVAPAAGGPEKIIYEVADGRADPVSQTIPITVLEPDSGQTSAPVAEPDIARGQAGKPITVKPLANDLPGADPTNPDAELALAGTIASPAGVKVETDLTSGTVTVIAARHGTFVLRYTAAFGNAKFSQAPIRIDVAVAPPSAQPPIAVPDTGVVYGQTAATIDVLANDFDPAGGVLVVQRATPDDDAQVEVSVLDGHFLQVAARQPRFEVNPQVIRYTLTNGLTPPVTGELTVTQMAPRPDSTPLALDDFVTVRSGDTALVPVLDNDIEPSGARLSLLDNVPVAAPGALRTAGDDTNRGDLGAAFVTDRQVRYVAPAVITRTSVTIGYVARNPGGDRAAGTVHVTVVPPPSAKNPDQAPVAVDLSSRAISGETVRITIPTTGIDPDGDTADVVGITAAPTIGRVVSIGSTSITYEAFPTSSGTDRIGYLVSDRYGRTSGATISIGVAQVSDPQPPRAVDDVVTAAPGAQIRVDVLANDVIAPDDSVTLGDPRKLNPEISPAPKLVKAGGPLQVVAPRADGMTSNVLYSVTDGVGDPSIGTVSVRSQKGYVPPPSAADVPATPGPAQTSTTVDVLAKATDPQGLPLRISKVYDRGASFRGPNVTVPVLTRVQNIVYQIKNSQGGTAAAVIHVPARGTGAPYVTPRSLITIGVDGTTTIDIGDYTVSPADRPLRLTTLTTISTAPGTGLRLTSPDPTHLTLTGVNGYNGPAAITFEVTDGATLNDPNAQHALITIQVQVGPNTPVIRCPSAPIRVVEGGPDRRLDITALCHVWVADRSQLRSLDYTASWTRAAKDVDILGSGSQIIGLRAGGSAVPGQDGELRIGVKGTSARSSLNVTVLKLGRASMNAIRIEGFAAGSTATRDITGSVDSPLRDPQISVVRIDQVGGQPSRATATGARVDITPGKDSHGLMTFDIVGTDVADKARKDRQFSGRLTLEVLSVPDAPGTPQVGATVLSQTAVLSWSTPPANGAQIDRYQVQWPGGSRICAASPCRITGLTNGQSYRFRVRAHNAVGFSDPSGASAVVTPDKRPAAVAGVTVSDPQDHTVRLSWKPVDNGGTAPTKFLISWSGGGTHAAAGSTRSYLVPGLDNHNVYDLRVVAVNRLGAGPAAATRGQSAGAPPAPTSVGVQYTSAAGTTSRTVSVTWAASDPNGPGPSTYAVSRGATVICRNVTATTCADSPAAKQTYTYTVVASNDAGHPGAAGSSAPFVVTGTPDTLGSVRAQPTDKDGEVTVSYVATDAHGQKPRVECTSSTGGGCGTWTPPAAGRTDTHTIGGLGANIDVTITLKLCNEQQCGTPSTSPPAHTAGPPAAPSVQCSLSGTTITWTWNRPAAINGHTVTTFALGDSGAGTTAQLRFAKSFPKDGANHNLTVQSIDDRGEAGGRSAANCKGAPKPDPPTPPTLKIGMGAGITKPPQCISRCHYITYSVAHLTANKNYTFSFNDVQGDFPHSFGLRTDGGGAASGRTDTFYGGPHNAGNGTITGYIVGMPSVSDSCSGNWQTGSGC